MKKLRSVVLSLVIIASLPAGKVCAEGTPDLQTLADSLGAKTDYINIPNFVHDEERKILNSSYVSYLSTCTNYETLIHPDMFFSKSLSKGCCFGISTLEVLAHNGVISPSDILDGAEKMCEIGYSEPVDHFVAGYHAMQCHYELMYANYEMALNCTAKEQADILISTAQECMENNKYFSIACYTSYSGHQIVGIGIADGNWEYNEKNYDKCILTLDSNNKDENGNVVPFKESTCIYINSDEGSIYIPEYEYSSDDDLLISVIDDDSLLNYKGLIDPSEKYETDLSSSNIVTLWYEPMIKYDVKAYDGNDNLLKFPDTDNKIQMMPASYTYLLQGNKFHVDSEVDTSQTERLKPRVRVQNLAGGFDLISREGSGIFDIINNKEFKITSQNNSDIKYELLLRFNEGYYPFSPHYNQCFFGHTDSFIKAEVVENGILLSSDSVIETAIDTGDVKIEADINGDILYYMKDNPIKTSIVANNNVLVSFDENNKMVFYIDPDKNDVYDTLVEKGDVNSDGIIDGRDATAVLTSYAKQSVESTETSYINPDFADYDSNGVVDGRDATNILTKYAESSVQ